MQCLPITKNLRGSDSEGMEYLKSVREEAAECDQIVFHEFCGQTVTFEEEVKAIELLQLLPQKGWTETFANEFSNLKDTLPKRRHEDETLPLLSDMEGWFKWCYETTDNLNLTTLSQLSQRQTLKLLSLHLNWIKKSIERIQAAWLYWLLVVLDPVLIADQVSILRMTCRRCIELRNTCIEPNKDTVVYANIIITIIRTYYGQQDLQ